MKCYNVGRPKNISRDEFKAKVTCIARKLSVEPNIAISEALHNKDWAPLLDYNLFTNNCGSSTKFIVECAGGHIKRRHLISNISVGDDVDFHKKAKILYKEDGVQKSTKSSYGEVCELALSQCGH